VTYASKAQIKGCVRMKYKCMEYSQSGSTCQVNGSTANVPGLSDTSGQAAPLEYCTQAGKSPYVAGTQNSDFLNKSPELMDFPLDLPNSNWPNNEDISMEYALDKPVELKPETPAKLTLAVDLNRMLRYYNRGRQDQSVNPGAPMNKAFFFTTVFADSTHVFVGAPGRIYGYEMIARVCPNGETYDAGTGICSGNNGFHTSVPFWMTLITGSNGGPVKMIMMPDDDNDYTITKGSDRDAVRCAIDASLNDPRKPWVRVTNGSSTAEIHYALCDNEDNSTPLKPGPHGHLSGFPIDLDSATVVPGATSIADSPANSDPNYLQGVTIYTNQRQKASTTGNVHYGKVVIMRRL
jgi:hypothetical protein